MSHLEAIIFGIVQGITEFLPVSSSAHIVITELLLGFHFPGLAFEVFLHIASLIAVCFYFRNDLREIISGFFEYLIRKNQARKAQYRFGWYIITATAITGVLGMTLKGQIGDAMKTPGAISLALTATGIILICVERIIKYGSRTQKDMNLVDAIVVGLGQTVAILPGISRSGATLAVSLMRGLSRDTAVRYSFLLAVPVILGSSVLMLGKDSIHIWSEIGISSLILSFVSALVFSWIGIVWLINFLKKSRLIYFALYCFVVAALVRFFVEPAVIF